MWVPRGNTRIPVNNELYLKEGERKLKRLSIAVVLSLLIATPCIAKEIIADWVKGQTSIVWGAIPRDYPEKVTSKDSIVWIGVIEDAAAYINDQKETVIEFLCRNMLFERPGPESLTEPIRIKDSDSGYFVISLRSPSLPLEQAKDYKEEVRKVRHYAAVLGEPVDRRNFSGRSAVYVHSQKAEMSDKLKVQILK